MPPHSSYLRLDVRGGLNNQRECIVNGIVAAHELGLHLVLPSAHPVGQGTCASLAARRTSTAEERMGPPQWRL